MAERKPPAAYLEFARFVIWAEKQLQVPTPQQIKARYDVCLMTAYRWRDHYADASGKYYERAQVRTRRAKTD